MKYESASALGGTSDATAATAVACERPSFAALDLGTNNCRLLVARPVDPGRLCQGFEVIDAFSRIVRLGDGMTRSDTLSIAAMDRTIAALRICAGKLQRARPQAVRIVGTEACRRARNGVQFLRRVTRETGLEIEIITAGEEARLALAGCAALLTDERPHALLFDIGGGSTELMWLDVSPDGPPSMRAWISLPAGVVSLADRHAQAATTQERFQLMRDHVLAQLGDFAPAEIIADEIARGRVQMLGCSGTVTTLAGIHQQLPRYDRSRIDGCFLGREDIIAVTASLLAMNDEERLCHPCIGRGRADLVIAGCAILDAILTLWPIDRLRVADRGVREGILLGLMGAAPPLFEQHGA
jgi:exopolyphosphatase/guanosine-5'-triphosphate,3'-diphosphate pyrophosphatase